MKNRTQDALDRGLTFKNGIAYDQDGNEYRDENGECVVKQTICQKCGAEYSGQKCPECLATNKKAFYIYSFECNCEKEYDWFVGEDCESYDEQEMEVKKYMIENDYAENYEEASERLIDVYKQETKSLLKELKGN